MNIGKQKIKYLIFQLHNNLCRKCNATYQKMLLALISELSNVAEQKVSKKNETFYFPYVKNH